MNFEELKKKWGFKRADSKKKIKKFSFILFILLIAAIYFYTRSNLPSPTELVKYVDDCESALLSTDRTYVICCLENGRLYLCNEKRSFKPGDYVGFQINLQKLNTYFDPYYACMSTNFPISETPMPKKYTGNLLDKNISKYESFTCSKLFRQSDYHHVARAGYILDIPGEYNIINIWVLPAGNYNTAEDFINNLDEGMLVFSLSGEIIE